MAEIEEDFSDINLDTTSELDGVGQPPEREWFNDYGLDTVSNLQVQVPDIDLLELFRQEAVADELDYVEDAEIDAEMRLTEEDVPYDYQYWLHTPTEFPDDAPSAPPESGDVDPETGEVVP